MIDTSVISSSGIHYVAASYDGSTPVSFAPEYIICRVSYILAICLFTIP